jgi:cell division septation protein DedD
VKPLSLLRKIVSRKNRPIKISTAAQNAAVKLVAPKSPKKKTFVALKEFFKRKRPALPPRKPAGESAKLKNGWLALAVIGAVSLAGLLAVANIKLIRDPAILGKTGPSKQVSERPETGTAVSGPSVAPDDKSSHERPEVTFYHKLTTQDEHKIVSPDIPCQIQETDITDKRASAKGVTGAAQGKSEGAKTKHQGEKAVATDQTHPQPATGPTRYTVQVGAFSHPSIAQEWAIKWKSRGYDVSMKPVARPNTGIIYRLYLGNFPSEKQADELVRHLKAKEGISALRLIVRN